LGFIAVDWPEAVYCGVMGRQSAQLVERLGVPAHRLVYPCSPNNSETEDSHGLANLIGQMFPQGDCEVIVCKGPKGRSDFGKRLIHENYSFSQLECYDRLVINQTELECKQLLALGENAVMWLTSSETIGVLDEQLLSSFPDEVPAFRSLCVLLTTHPRITTKCLELGYARVFQISTGIQSVKEWLDIQKKT
jgi:uroporphyrinogen-III synthase